MDDNLLVGLSQIGKFLNRCPRTVQRWQQHQGLPVLRDPGGRPMALQSHIIEWLLKYNRENIDMPGADAALATEADIQKRHTQAMERGAERAFRTRGRF